MDMTTPDISLKQPDASQTKNGQAQNFKFLYLPVSISLWGIAACLFLSYSSYDFNDPSFNTAINSFSQNLLGHFGGYLSDFLHQFLGKETYFLIIFFAFRGHRFLKKIQFRVFLLSFLLCLVSVFILAMSLTRLNAGTSVLEILAGNFLQKILSIFPPRTQETFITVPLFFLGSFLYVFSLGLKIADWQKIFRKLWITAFFVSGKTKNPMKGLWKFGYNMAKRHKKEHYEPSFEFIRGEAEEISDGIRDYDLEREEEYAQPTLKIEPRFQAETQKTTSIAKIESVPGEHFEINLSETGKYRLPPLNLLTSGEDQENKITISKRELEENALQLKTVLEDFGIRGDVVSVRPGPVVTLYELVPAPGIKASRIIGLADDIARSMSAVSARVAVIPGKNAIGIELPNVNRQTVYLRDLFTDKSYEQSGGTLTLALGKDISGAPVTADLAKMPHLLVAGTTGSGKSVSVNAMILSLLYRLPPSKCKFIMIDPKMLELSVYDGIPHLLTPVVTDPRKAVVALKWVVREMETRYRAMSEMGVRNIDGYNARIEEALQSNEKLTRRIQTGFDPDSGKPSFEEQNLSMEELPLIVVIVDEMADLMLVAGKDVEAAIQRLAQMARAAGIHIIMATQRPSVDVITGTIKANFPTRISFQVTSKIDSRTILSEGGAEQLLGKGDMLHMAGGGRISRIHGPFVSDREVENVVKFWTAQGRPEYVDTVTQDSDEPSLMDFGMGGDDSDGLFAQAVDIVRRERKASTSFIQRHLKIGYNRAAGIIDQMEKEGVISAANHVGRREVLVPPLDKAG